MRAKATAAVILLCIVALSGFACGENGEEPSPARTTAPEEKPTFASDRDSTSGIYVMDTDDSPQPRLTDGPTDDVAPSWSP